MWNLKFVLLMFMAFGDLKGITVFPSLFFSVLLGPILSSICQTWTYLNQPFHYLIVSP